MPTGYTAGIVDETTTTFPEFAKLCMRAFGATIHLRDEDLTSDYQPDKPSDYHFKAIKKAEADLEIANNISDEELVKSEIQKLTEKISYYQSKILETGKAKIRLENFLNEALNYTPPTPDHQGVKDFMIQQLTDTINNDGKTDYYDKALKEAEIKLDNIDFNGVRLELILTATKDLAYHKEEYIKEVKRCNERNNWVSNFLDSLQPQNH